MTNEEKPKGSKSEKSWVRIPDGTRVRCGAEGQEGSIDGLTEIVRKGSNLNPDGKTQYRIDVGTPERRLAAEADLLILTDREGLVLMGKTTPEYRRHITEQLHRVFNEDRFVT
ncbi:MAG: hypothetical protein C4293_17815 [Nitrospiraceae bacterium]